MIIDAFAAVPARIRQALINVQLTIGSVEAIEAFAAIGVSGRNTAAIGTTRIVSTMINLLAMMTFPTHRTSTSVIRKALKAACPAVLTRTIGTRVVRNGDFTEGCLVADGTGTFKGRPPGGGHDDRTCTPVLAFLASGVTGVLVLAVFSGVGRWTPKKV